MFWNLISIMAATVSSWGRSRVGPNTTPRFATVIKFCLWLLATLRGSKRNGTNERNSKWQTTDFLHPSHLQTPRLVGARPRSLESKERLFYSEFHLPKFQKSPVLGYFAISWYDTLYNSHFAEKKPITNQPTKTASLQKYEPLHIWILVLQIQVMVIPLSYNFYPWLLLKPLWSLAFSPVQI